VSRNVGEKRLTVVFLDVAKAFDTVGVDGLLYKLTVLNFLMPCQNHISYFNSRTFEAPFQIATFTYRVWTGVAQVGIISPVLFSLYVNHLPSISHHFELALYADDTSVLAPSCQPALLVKYLGTYFSDLKQCLFGRSPLMSRRARRYSSLRPLDSSRNPE